MISDKHFCYIFFINFSTKMKIILLLCCGLFRRSGLSLALLYFVQQDTKLPLVISLSPYFKISIYD